MAQDTTGTNLAANWDDARVEPVCKVYADWNLDGDWSDADEDITAYVDRVTITHRLLDTAFGLPVLAGGRPSTAVITLRNPEHRFSPENTADGLAATYASIADRKAYRVPVMVDIGYHDPVNGDEVLRQFTGQIESAQPLEMPGRRELTYTCKGLDGFIERYTRSTDMQQDKRIDTIIAAHLTAAGLTSQDLDAGLFVLPFEWTDDTPLLAHLQSLAAADGGWLYWSKEGQARYERATHWLEGADHLAPVAVLTEGKATRQSHETVWRNVYSKVLVRYGRMAAGPILTVYEQAEPIEVAPNSTETVTARFIYPITGLITPKKGKDYKVSTPTGTDMKDSCSLSISADAAQAELTFTNSHATLSFLVRGLALKGYTVLMAESQQVRVETTLSLIDGEREYQMADNKWIVRKEQAQFVANRLLNLLERPREVITWTGRLCPFLELGDRVTVKNTAQGLDEDCYVMGLRLSYGRSARMEVDLLPSADTFPRTGYFTLDSSDYAAVSDPVYH